ncbi:E3 ubiquitin-protein ligase TRIM9 isoform X3 [Folsomia candida]|uniref:E3 ubiquitin-protein ligase TRIM9 isoform X3 n=1 Tax=Folsomia candida TaxID=158441 RepID=UPI001604A7D6|nr:E3 ubiquitin-protein ligase TRIM9 isoform X3 [Folsomia candida]
MEEELKCAVCKQLFANPVLLPCYHSTCLNCAVQIQSPVHQQSLPATSNTNLNGHHSHVSTTNFHGHSHHIVITTATVHHNNNNGSTPLHQNLHHNQGHHNESNSVNSFRADSDKSSTTSSTSSQTSGGEDSSDKVSVLSETDSGVVICSNSSRPNSYVSSHNMHGLLFPPIQSTSFCLSCPVCHKTVYFDENGAHNLPKYRVMQNIVDRYIESRNLGTKCQMCERSPKLATVMCEQCEIFYCDKCQASCHPQRGPLAKHSLVNPTQGKVVLKEKAGPLDYFKCPDHSMESLNMYCMLCKVPVCIGCLQDMKHADHDVQPIQHMSKAQKTDLSHNLQQLSGKAKAESEFIQRLKTQTEKINESSLSLEKQVTAQVDAIIENLQRRKHELMEFIHKEKEYKLRSLKAEVSSHGQRLQNTTSLIQFCIEALKETDPLAFLQIGSLLLARVRNLETSWISDLDDSASATDGSTMQMSSGRNASYLLASMFNPELDLTLDDRGVTHAIRQLNFIQMKPPGPVVIIPEECSAENNSVTIAWQPPPTSFVEGYVLELDDGAGGAFREVYCGKETICTVDGLHFNSLYNARVRSFNSTGEGGYSDTISLQTAEVAWFTFDPSLIAHGVRLLNENNTATTDSYEPRLILGSVGFARGVHYWEFSVDKYDASADPSFGIARIDAAKDEMLGKDDKGWGMYVDHQRSWFIHCGVHSCRTEGGIGTGSTVGILLDLDRRQISFYVNEEQQGPVAFTSLYGVFYPAVSLNCNVTVTLHTAMEHPVLTENGTLCRR